MVHSSLICSLARETNFEILRGKDIYILSAEQFQLPGLFVVEWKLRSLEGGNTAPYAFARVLMRETRLFRRLSYLYLISVRRHIFLVGYYVPDRGGNE